MSLRKANGSRQGDCWACCCNRPRQVRDFSLHRDELIIAPEPRRGCCGKGSCGNFGCCCTRVGDRCCGSSSTQLHLNNGCCGSHPGKTYKIQRPPEGNYENDRADKLFTVEVSSLRGSHKQKITIKAKSVQEKADWLEQLEAALRYRSDTRVVGPPSTDLLDRRKTAQQLAEKLNMQLMMHQRTNTQPTLDSWSVWRSASAAGRRALQQDDRDVAGEQLIEELAEQLRGHRGARKAYQFKDSTFGRSLGTSESLGRWPGQDWAEAEIRWLQPHEIGERGVETVPFARASVVTSAAEQFEYQAGVLEEDECYGWLAAMCGCSMGLTQPNVIANVIHSADDVGLYGVRLFVNGRWITVSIDNEFPCEFRDGLWKPLFAGVREIRVGGVRKEELWPLILEKALAKYSGSYAEALATGMRTPDAAALLTGGLSLSYSISAPDGESRALVRDSADLEDEEPRQALLSSWEAVHEVVDGTDAAVQICWCGVRPERARSRDDGLPLPVFVLLSAVHTSQGKLLRLCAPWTSAAVLDGTWGGKFGSDDLVWTPQLVRECRGQSDNIPAGRHERDCFWMGWEDFQMMFGEVGVCKQLMGHTAPGAPPLHSGVPRPDLISKVHCTTVAGEWRRGQSAGGMPPLVLCRHNPTFTINVHDANTHLVNLNSVRRLHLVAYPQRPPQQLCLYVQGRQSALMLRVTVVEAQDLPGSDGLLTKCNPYVKIRVGPSEPQRSNAKTGTTAPRWDETYNFEIADETSMEKTDVVFECWDQHMGFRDEMLGSTTVALSTVVKSEPSRYEQWLSLDEVRHGECGKLHVRCEIDRQLPQLRPLLQCFEQCASAELEIPVSNCFLHFVRFVF